MFPREIEFFIRQEPNTATAGSARINAKKKRDELKKKVVRRAKKKGTEAQRVKPLTPTWAFDELIRDEEHTVKKINTKWVSNPTTLDHSNVRLLIIQ